MCCLDESLTCTVTLFVYWLYLIKNNIPGSNQKVSALHNNLTLTLQMLRSSCGRLSFWRRLVTAVAATSKPRHSDLYPVHPYTVVRPWRLASEWTGFTGTSCPCELHCKNVQQRKKTTTNGGSIEALFMGNCCADNSNISCQYAFPRQIAR